MVDDTRQLLGGNLHEVFCNSSSFMCIYNTVENTILDLNSSVRTHSGCADFKVELVLTGDNGKRYVQLNGTPCKLKVLSMLKNDVAIMTMFLAHTKKWTQTSDLVSLTDTTSDGVWEWFPELNYEYMSERFWNILGYQQKDMDENPMSWMGFLNPDDVTTVERMCKEHVSSRGEIPYITRARYTHKDGKEVIVLCRGSVVDWMPDGRPWRLLGTHTDITDLVKKDAVEAKTRFISRMSHEIRSPICTILNECELIRNTNTSVIRDTCKHLISLTDDILKIDKQHSQDIVLNVNEDNLPDLLAKCSKRHRVEAKKRGMKIRTTIEEIPGNVMIDVGKFNQVLDNLIGNAFKYSNDGCITLDVEYENETSICSIRVIDQGIGMDPNFHASAFEELVQGDTTMLGAGIGLTLCRILAKAMGGNVTIEKSSLGKGTTMLFESLLPVAQQSDVYEESSGLDGLTELKVLIVDDIATNRTILKRRLCNMVSTGLKVTETVEAVNGQDAVDKFASCSGDFHLVLMDCLMPILDGFDATVKIHDICDSLGIDAVPVVAVTASVSSGIHDRCLSFGMNYVVTKPFSEIDLMTSIQACVKKGKY